MDVLEKDQARIVYDGLKLSVQNQFIKRTWQIIDNVPYQYDLLNLKTEQSIAGQSEQAAFNLPFCDNLASVEPVFASRESAWGLGCKLTWTLDGYNIVWLHEVDLNAAWIRQHIEIEKSTNNLAITKVDNSSDTSLAKKGQTLEGGAPKLALFAGSYTDTFDFANSLLAWDAYQFLDQTDHHDNPIQKLSGAFYPFAENDLYANLLDIGDFKGKSRCLILQEGPARHGYRTEAKKDVLLSSTRVYLTNTNYTLADFTSDTKLVLPASIVMLYTNHHRYSLSEILHAYTSWRWPSLVNAEKKIVCNSWGDRGRDTHDSDFYHNEISLASHLGLDIYQLDDGWQEGKTQNSALAKGVWEGYYAYNPKFWDVRKTSFPEGLSALSAYSQEKNVDLSLWFSPDSSQDFSNWQKDITTLKYYADKFNISSYKFDAVKIRSALGHNRLRQIKESCKADVEGGLSYYSDMTAEIRPGFWAEDSRAIFFLENRYTDWGNYYPSRTLKNLWELSHFLPSRRIQVECLNVERNLDKYNNTAQGPADYGFAYSLATSIMGSPLMWMELKNLSDRQSEILADFVKTYKLHRDKLATHMVYPIGERPSSDSWTGFFTLNAEGKQGYLLVFREDTTEDSFAYDLPFLEENGVIELEPIWGDTTENYLEILNGQAEITLKKKQSFAWYECFIKIYN